MSNFTERWQADMQKRREKAAKKARAKTEKALAKAAVLLNPDLHKLPKVGEKRVYFTVKVNTGWQNR